MSVEQLSLDSDEAAQAKLQKKYNTTLGNQKNC